MSDESSQAQQCLFCGITAGESIASVVYEDDVVVVFMDRYPVVPGHLLVVPRTHSVGLTDTDEETSTHVWRVGHRMSHAIRRSSLRSEGINVLLCDGVAAAQTVFHLHLHIIPRFDGDGWRGLGHVAAERERAELDREAAAIRAALETI